MPRTISGYERKRQTDPFRQPVQYLVFTVVALSCSVTICQAVPDVRAASLVCQWRQNLWCKCAVIYVPTSHLKAGQMRWKTIPLSRCCSKCVSGLQEATWQQAFAILPQVQTHWERDLLLLCACTAASMIGSWFMADIVRYCCRLNNYIVAGTMAGGHS